MGKRIPDDEDAYLWGDQAPAIGAMLQQVAAELAQDSRFEAALCDRVAERMQSELRMPAVKEALGCLIPEGLHSSLDTARGRQQKAGRPAQRSRRSR